MVASICVEGTVMTRVHLSDAKAKCLDGSPYSYYVSPGTNKTKFVFNHQGGGWCSDLSDCAGRAKSALGSSASWTDTVNMGDSFAREPNQNPLMNTWTFVYLPYCDGGSFTGDAVSSTTPPLYFYGLGNRDAVVASLRASYGFSSATDIVVSGCSAGGLAAYLHVDYYAKQVPSARTTGLPDSGFFLDGDYARDGQPNYEGRMTNLYTMMNSVAGITNTDCTSKIGYQCLFALHLLPYIQSHIFTLNSAYDATMANGQCGHSGIVFNWSNATSVTLCGNYVRSLVKSLLKSPDAAFLDACQHHCGYWGGIHIDGLTSPFAHQIWYEKGASSLPNGGYMDQNQNYPCTTACCA